MKSVLISIQPKYVELIASGKKTIEVRKTVPKGNKPFKVYIYQTKKKWIYRLLEKLGLYQGKVIGEFICDRADKQIVFHKGITRIMILGYKEKLFTLCKAAALSLDELHDYIDKDGKDLELVYGWHISDLKIYDKPKELEEFKKPCPQVGCTCGTSGACNQYLTRPPQSWCYVEV